MSKKDEEKQEPVADSPDVEYLKQNYDNQAQTDYIAQNSPAPEEGMAAGDVNEPIPASELPATTKEGKPVVTLEVDETVTKIGKQ